MSARSSVARGAWKGERSPAVASAHPSTGTGLSGSARSRPPRRRRSGRRGGPPRPRGRCAPGRRRPPRPWRPSAPACGPPRPGPGGGSSARRRRRPGAPPSRTRASAGPARDAGGCPPGRRARGRPRAGGAPWRWRRRPTRRRSSTRRRRPRRPSGRRIRGHAAQVLVHQHGLRVPQEARSVRKVDAGVRFVAAWPMRLRGSIPGVTHRIRCTVCLPGGAAAGTRPREEAP